MPETFQKTRLWLSTLASQEGDAHAHERDRLRASFISFRERASILAAEIHRVLPDYTVHDITHLDALWDVAELVAGSEFRLTPTEAYILGGAFLLHDLGMGLASYPGGLDDLKKDRSWSDVVVKEFLARYNRSPSTAEVSDPPRDVQDIVVGTLLRLLHARQAETLATSPWQLRDNDPPQFLIEDTELRQAFGRTIGRIAHSHWWTVDRIDDEFARTLGAPYWCPHEWTVDPLKIACLLRLADAAHIDARRAPPFLRRIRRPAPSSDEHWNFQEKLQKPQIAEDALVFTSGYAFAFGEASSWWLCLDTLEMIDRELRRVDALLADRKLPRFAARRVAGVDSPERLVAYIPTDGWLPVDAALQVNDLPRVIETLGGTELYGRDLRIPLRELIQNGADAVRARRVVDRRGEDWGEIIVRLEAVNGKEWLSVGDTGIGMSRDVLVRYLLDFGTTYWSSSLMLSEFPGLLTSGFTPTGKYGIGFFSTFMLGDSVSVITRRYDAAQADTQVLEFGTGVSGRPILRPAREEERLREGGTIIRVRLRQLVTETHGLLSTRRGRHVTLAAICEQIAPSLDVDLLTQEYAENPKRVIVAGDWRTISAVDLLRRTHDYHNDSEEEFDTVIAEVQPISTHMSLIEDGDQIFGRACIVPEWIFEQEVHIGGVITVGGLTASPIQGIAGLLVGSSRRAARDVARPVVPATVISKWATEQATIVATTEAFDDEERIEIASIVWGCGGDPGPLPIISTSAGYRTWAEIADAFKAEDEILIMPLYSAKHMREILPTILFLKSVIFTSSSIYTALRRAHSSDMDLWPIDMDVRWPDVSSWVMGSITGAVIAALSQAWGIPVEVLAKRESKHMYSAVRVVATVLDRDIAERVTVITRQPTDDTDAGSTT